MIQLNVLGSLDLRDQAGRTLDHVLAQPKRLALLVYLSLASPRDYHRRDKLVALFWPELDDAHARNALSKAVHFLRRGVGDDAIEVRGDELRVARDKVGCDAVLFDELVELDRLADALALYRGDLLEGFFLEEALGFERWLDDERDRIKRRAALSAQRLALTETNAGRLAEAAEWIRRELDLHPDDEGALRRFVLALHHSGDRAGALREFDRAVRRLADDYGVEPSRETRRVREVLEQPAPSAESFPVAPQSLRVPDTSGRTAPLTASQAGRHFSRRSRALAAITTGVAIIGAGWFLSAHRRVDRSSAVTVGSIAVLPFANRSDDSSGEYLSDGITDELIARLAEAPGLRVAARTSAFTYKTRSEPMRDVANRLNVDAVLEGTARRTPDSIRITARLVDPGTDAQLWAGSYQRTAADVPDIESLIAQATLTALGHDYKARSIAGSGRAYDLYLKGHYYYGKFETDDVRRALQYFSQAIDVDPTFALGYAGLSDAYYQLSTRWIPADQAMPKARAAATHALELDSELAEAHVALSRVQAYWEYDWDGAERSLRRALALKPGLASVHEAYGLLLMFRGRSDSALAQLRKAQELDPLAPGIAEEAVWPLFLGGRVTEALEAYGRVAQGYQTDGLGASLGEMHVLLGEYSTAIELIEKYNAKHQDMDARYYAVLARAYHAVGREQDAHAILDMLLARSHERDFGNSYMLAILYAGLGERERALEWLERCDSVRNENIVLTKVDPELASLRSEPRFEALLRRIGLD